MDIFSMKSLYKECEVDVTAVYVLPAKRMLTPRVVIHYENITGPNWLTTKETFKSAREAELFGAMMAQEWIDENVR
jgi:hypothetical protein